MSMKVSKEIVRSKIICRDLYFVCVLRELTSLAYLGLSQRDLIDDIGVESFEMVMKDITNLDRGSLIVGKTISSIRQLRHWTRDR